MKAYVNIADNIIINKQKQQLAKVGGIMKHCHK